MTTNQKGMFGKFSMCYNLKGVANMILLKAMASHYEVTYNSKDREGVLIVHTPDGKVAFVHHPWGVYFLDLSLSNNAEIMLAMTLKDQYEDHTRHRLM